MQYVVQNFYQIFISTEMLTKKNHGPIFSEFITIMFLYLYLLRQRQEIEFLVEKKKKPK